MEKLLPIVEGCEAIILRDENYNSAGKKCVVGKFYGDAFLGMVGGSGKICVDDDIWQVFGDFNAVNGAGYLSEKDLMRIDGYQEDEKSESKVLVRTE